MLYFFSCGPHAGFKVGNEPFLVKSLTATCQWSAKWDLEELPECQGNFFASKGKSWQRWDFLFAQKVFPVLQMKVLRMLREDEEERFILLDQKHLKNINMFYWEGFLGKMEVSPSSGSRLSKWILFALQRISFGKDFIKGTFYFECLFRKNALKMSSFLSRKKVASFVVKVKRERKRGRSGGIGETERESRESVANRGWSHLQGDLKVTFWTKKSVNGLNVGLYH